MRRGTMSRRYTKGVPFLSKIGKRLDLWAEPPLPFPPPQDKTLLSIASGSIVTFRGCKWLQILVPLSGDQDGMPIFLSFELAKTILIVQHRAAILEQCCNYWKQCRNNVAMLCCAKNRRCESSRLTSL